MSYILYHSPHTGSQIVKDALELCQADFKIITLDYEKVAAEKEPRLKKVNPLSRLPTLILPDKKVMTESGAMILHLAAKFPRAKLAPKSGTPEYDLFLRLLFTLTGEIYPTFTFADIPSEFVKTVSAREPYRKQVRKFRTELWHHFQKMIDSKGPWALGKDRSAIDLYLSTMTLWGPGKDWFIDECPQLAEIGKISRELSGWKA